jgi:diguanylate cyclase (GGDEF)-like protein/PAS domain S-box-containing protein
VNNDAAGFAPATDQTETRARQQAVVATLGHRALSGADAPSLMNDAVSAIARVLKVSNCNVLELIPGTKTFRLCAAIGWKDSPRDHVTVPGGPGSQAAHTLTSVRPVIVVDYRTETRFKTPPFVPGLQAISGASVVIPGREQPFGVLAVGSNAPRKFDEEDVSFLQGVANVLAAAVDRRRAEETLKETSQQLRALVHTAPLAVISLDANGCVRGWNATAERIFGWNADEVIGKPDPVLSQGHHEELYALFERVLQGEAFTEVAAQVAKKDGGLVEVAVSIAPIYDSGGAINGIIAVVADLTDRRRTEAAQQQLTEIIETTTDCVVITNVPGRGFYINQAGRRMLAIGLNEDVSGVNLPDLYPAETRPVIINEAMPAAVRDGGWSGETVLASRDGREIPVSMVMIAHKGSEGHVEFFSIIARDISDQKRFQAQLVRLASHDHLTDLYNRRRLEEELDLHLAESRRYGIRGALLFVDLDQFKDVNDSLGHLVGDQLLVRVAGLLRERLRETDVIARMGGDEFAILLPHTDADQAQELAGQIIEAMQTTTITAEERPIGATASIGIALFPEHGVTVGDLLARADLAMYHAKENGRNQFSLFELGRDWQAAIASRLNWQRRIREALEQDLFVFQAQPILDLRTDKISHYELLLRMTGGKGELIVPGAFLDTAERFGLIHAIDRWVVKRAIRLIAAHRHRGRSLRLVINVSAKAFTDAELLPMIKRELGIWSVDPHSLTLEITETAAITNIYQAEKFVRMLKQMGCRIGLDDFGVGFASFYHLKHLPVDYLKIDGSFIRNLPMDPVDQQLVGAMVTVARSLGKETIAEFVSDAETVRLLREYGVDYVQGFHIGADAIEITSIVVDPASAIKRG